MDQVEGKFFLADTAYDSEEIRGFFNGTGTEVVIKPRANRKEAIACDSELYSNRYLVECAIHRLKDFRALATRYDKLARNYLSLVCLVATLGWIN